MIIEGYIACICEGAAERAIIDLLLENDRLTFTESQLLNGELIRCRDAKKFELRYLRKDFSSKITVLRVLDSRRENFKLSKAYVDKIAVIDVITAPEIEMLVIIEKQYENFKKSKKKPSEFCKSDLKYNRVKNYEFIKGYFSNVEELVESIVRYKQIANLKNGEYTLCDFLF